MFERRPLLRERMIRLISKFRRKGATSPSNAMTAEELNLPPRFKDFVRRPLVAKSEIFVEVDGKYYLNENRLGDLGRGSLVIPRGVNEMVSCEYCGSLTPSSSTRCPNCNAPRTK